MHLRFICILVLLSTSLLSDQNDYYMTMSTIKSRPLALGGAFVAMQNEWAALYYNPAGYHVSRTDPDKRFAVALNPLGLIFSFTERGTYSRGSVPVGWIINALGVRRGMVSVGILTGEESLANSERLRRSRFFDGADYQNNRNGAIGLAIEFAPRVRFGVAGDLFVREGGLPKLKFGYRYGLIVKPRSNLDVGLCYVDFAEENAEDRMTLERLADGTLNIGVAYAPHPRLKLFTDIRNVSGEVKTALLEPHFGLEVQAISCFAFQLGYYRARGGGERSMSFGAGCRDILNELFPGLPRSAARLDFDFAAVWQRRPEDVHRWFFLGFRLIL